MFRTSSVFMYFIHPIPGGGIFPNILGLLPHFFIFTAELVLTTRLGELG